MLSNNRIKKHKMLNSKVHNKRNGKSKEFQMNSKRNNNNQPLSSQPNSYNKHMDHLYSGQSLFVLQILLSILPQLVSEVLKFYLPTQKMNSFFLIWKNGKRKSKILKDFILPYKGIQGLLSLLEKNTFMWHWVSIKLLLFMIFSEE